MNEVTGADQVVWSNVFSVVNYCRRVLSNCDKLSHVSQLCPIKHLAAAVQNNHYMLERSLVD